MSQVRVFVDKNVDMMYRVRDANQRRQQNINVFLLFLFFIFKSLMAVLFFGTLKVISLFVIEQTTLKSSNIGVPSVRPWPMVQLCKLQCWQATRGRIHH